jgi:acyl-CoA reductase-like NAD-dependent aldehyde dehydrogenase
LQTAELRNLIERFQTEREQFLTRQKQIALQLREATDEQRAELREQMRDNLDQWREMQLEFRAQLRDRAVELRRELQGQLREVVSEGSKEGGEPRRRE